MLIVTHFNKQFGECLADGGGGRLIALKTRPPAVHPRLDPRDKQLNLQYMIQTIRTILQIRYETIFIS